MDGIPVEAEWPGERLALSFPRGILPSCVCTMPPDFILAYLCVIRMRLAAWFPACDVHF
jgi:hypothetical protein